MEIQYIQAKADGILYDHGRKPGIYYPDLELDNTFWTGYK